MKNSKRIIAMLLCLVMIVSLAACRNSTDMSSGSEWEWVESTITKAGDDSNTGNDVDSDTNNVGAGNDASDNSSGKDSTTSSNKPGSTTSRVQPSGNNNTIDSKEFEGQHLKLMLGFDKSDTSDIVTGYFEGLEAWMTKYKCTYEIVPTVQGYSTLQAAVAAGDAPDLFYQVGVFPEIVSVGLVQPIESYIPADQKYISQQSLEEATWAGHIYSIFSSEGVGKTYIGFNPDLFVERGEKTPREYFEEGNWTWETFRSVAKTMTGDGIYGCYSRNFSYFGCDYIINIADNGSISSRLDNKEISDFLQWYYNLYNVDKIFTTDSKQTYAMRAIQVDAEPVYSENGDLRPLGASGEQWEFVPFPAKDKNSKNVSYSYQYSFMVPVGVKKPAMSVSLALSMVNGWQSYVDGYNKEYTAYEKKVRAAVEGAKPVLIYPDVQTMLPNDPAWNITQFTPLITDPPATAINTLLEVHKNQCKEYNDEYVK